VISSVKDCPVGSAGGSGALIGAAKRLPIKAAHALNSEAIVLTACSASRRSGTPVSSP
jgi:hypothetical protein